MAADFLDGGALLAAAKEAYGMWKAQQEAARQKQVAKYLKRIDFRLDIVLANQQGILKELAELRLFVSEELARQHLVYTVQSFRSHQDRLRGPAALIDVSKPAALERLKPLELPMANFVSDLLQMGTRAFHATLPAMTAYLSLLALLKEAGESDAVVDVILSEFVDTVDARLASWFDETEADGFRGPVLGAIARRKQIEAEVAATDLRHPLGVVKTGKVKDYRTQYCEIHVHQTLVIRGDLSAGFSDTVVKGEEFVSKVCGRIDDGGPHQHLTDGEGGERIDLPSVESVLDGTYSARELPAMPAALVATEPSSVHHVANALLARESGLTAPAMHPVTKQLNLLRAEWAELLQVEATMAEMARIVAATRIDLARRKAGG